MVFERYVFNDATLLAEDQKISIRCVLPCLGKCSTLLSSLIYHLSTWHSRYMNENTDTKSNPTHEEIHRGSVHRSNHYPISPNRPESASGAVSNPQSPSS